MGSQSLLTTKGTRPSDLGVHFQVCLAEHMLSQSIPWKQGKKKKKSEYVET